MKSYLLAFFTLAAAVTTVAVNGELMTKKEYVALFTKKLNQKKAGHSKRERYDSDTCRVKVCGDNGDLCPSGDIVCSGYLGCFNGTCTHSKPGDKCIYYGVDDDTCYSSSLRCYKDRCVEYAEEGDRCTYENEYDCKTKDDKDGDEKLYCSASKSRDIGVCRKKNLEVGDECDVDKDYCNRTVSYCAAADGKTVGKCVALPDKLDKPCNTSHGNHGCNGEKLLYCNPKTEKCVQFPMAGERCTDSKCYPGYYCSGSFCKERKEINETCSYYNDHECKDGLVCAYDSNIGRVCKNNNPKEGEFCNSDIVCPDGLACENNTCVKKTWECKTNKDCKQQRK